MFANPVFITPGRYIFNKTCKTVSRKLGSARWLTCLAGPTFLHNTLVLPAGRFKRDLISDLICCIVVLPFLSNATFFLSTGRELARFVPS